MKRTSGKHRQKRKFGARGPSERRPDVLWIYGIHAAAAALGNPQRKVLRIAATQNALNRLKEAGAPFPVPPEMVTPRELDQLFGPDSAHQGIAVEVDTLVPPALADILGARLVVVLDQVTDPHNVGAIVRSAAAFGAGGLVTTARHAPAEGAVLAKSASGGLEYVPIVSASNLSRALEELGVAGFTRIGLDSAGSVPLEDAMSGERIALVLGAEGRGLRKGTRAACDVVARLDMPGAIKSLNVSNAAVLALYLAQRHLAGRAETAPAPTRTR
jgi:23S rRNA (guanosine2251-2'-O)-methyltransferase